MADHTVKAFSDELDQLSNELARMGGLTENSVSDSIIAITRRDAKIANEVIERDAMIDAAHRDIERAAIRVMALRHPFAADLRQVITAWRIAGELERIGDLSKNIARRSIIISQSAPIPLTRGIERMGKIASGHLKQVLDAWSNRDVRAAIGVWFQDEEIDTHYNSLFRELLTYMMEDPRTISSCAHLLFVAKNFERIGDHCTNIAEMVHFLVTGEEIATQRPKADAAPLEADD